MTIGNTSALVCSDSLDDGDQTRHLHALTQEGASPAVLRIVRKTGAAHVFETAKSRRRSCLPLRVMEWAVMECAPFDQSGESCMKIKYADGASRTFVLDQFVWQTIGMDRVRLQYTEKQDGD